MGKSTYDRYCVGKPVSRLSKRRVLMVYSQQIICVMAADTYQLNSKEDPIMASAPRAFVSFDFDNNSTDQMLFCGQAVKDSPTPFTVQDWSSKSALPEKEWQAAIKEKIGRTNMLIVLVGNSMASATGVNKEIQFAKDLNVPFFGVYIGGAGITSTLPTGLARNRVITWKWPNIAAAIEQMMGEGKNEKV
jgi:hypothetical protein